VALLGGAGGLLLAIVAVPVLVELAPANVPRLNEVAIDWPTFLFTLGISTAVGMFCALVAALPARQVPKAVGGAAQLSAPAANRFRRAVAVSEIALALMLAVAATLMVRTVRELNAIDLGFDPRAVVTADLASSVGAGMEAREAHSVIIDRVKGLPGVKEAGIGIGPLAAGGMFIGGLRVPGDAREFDLVAVDAVSPGYFEALGARLVAGRFFTRGDTARDGRDVILLNRSAARLFWRDANPIGRSVIINDKQQLHVIGVVADIRGRILEKEPDPTMYQLSSQSRNFLSGSMVIRVEGDADTLGPAIASVIHSLDRELPFRGVVPLQERIDRAMAPRLFVLRLVGLFSVIGLVLAVIGVYGVLTEFVSQRVPEIGIRMAIGATARDVLRLIFGQGARLVALGLVLGVAGAALLRGVMTTMVYGVETSDPLAYATAGVLLLLATAAACLIPARRASRLDPVAALRSE
jgi:predicted permease